MCPPFLIGAARPGGAVLNWGGGAESDMLVAVAKQAAAKARKMSTSYMANTVSG